MAEILGVAASIVALIQLSEMVNKTASKYMNTVKGTQSSLLPLLSKTESLRGILVALQAQLETRSSDSPNSVALQYLEQPLDVCQNVMKRIEARLNNLTVVSGCVIGTILDKQTTAYLKNLDDLMPILHLALDADSLASVHEVERELRSLRIDGVEQFQSLQHGIQAHHEAVLNWKIECDQSEEASAREHFRRRVIDWLTLVDYESNHRSACQRHQPGTGSWIFESKEYMDWETGQNPHLWLSAMAGAGKTVLSSTIIRDLIVKYSHTSVAYFYFDFKDIAKQEVISLLASWVVQIARAFRPLPTSLVSLFQRHSVRDPDRPSLPTVDELTQVLKDVVKLQSPLFLVVDALDECRQRPLLLETLSALFDQDEPSCRVLCTSRAEADIQRGLNRLTIKQIHIRNIDSDVSSYVRAVLSSDDRLKCHRQVIKDLVEEELVKGAKGMFRWVQCQIDHIKTLRTAKDVKSALRKLPPDLDRTYDEILRSVPIADIGYLRCALQFAVFALRPMTLTEVAEAVVIEIGARTIDEDAKLQRPEDLLDIGKGLFAQPRGSEHDMRFLELSHYSVKEYLLSERANSGSAAKFCLHERSAQTDISMRCLTYLGLDVFESLWQDFDNQTWNQKESNKPGIEADFLIRGHQERLIAYPFLDYSAKHCFQHCKDEEVQTHVAPLVRNISSTQGSGRFRNMTYTCIFRFDASWESPYMRTFRYSLISVAASFGLAIIVEDLLHHDVPVDYTSPKPLWIEQYLEGQTALYRAAEFGHESLCNILISAGASLQGVGNYDCPLSAAGRSGNPAIVQMMLDAGADVRRDTTSVASTLLTTWWKYAEGDEKKRLVLEVFREGGAKWITIGLLKAFSGIGTLVVRRITEPLDHRLPGIRYNPEAARFIHNAVEELENPILQALQWLVRDPGGVDGLKDVLEKILLAVFNSQPQLLTQTPNSLTHKYNAEEVLAENIIRVYFKAVHYEDPTATDTFRATSQNSLLAALWENAYTSNASGTAQITATVGWEAEELIICGDILQALIRGRWDSSYSQFYV